MSSHNNTVKSPWFRKIIYTEFIYPTTHYSKSLKGNEKVFDWLLPVVIAALAYIFIIKCISVASAISVAGHMITALSVLIGFSITCLTVLSSAGGENIETLKRADSSFSIGGIVISLHRVIVANFAHALLVELLALVLSLGYVLLYSVASISFGSKAGFALILAFMIHVLFVNIRLTTNFYFVVMKDDTSRKSLKHPEPPLEDEEDHKQFD